MGPRYLLFGAVVRQNGFDRDYGIGRTPMRDCLCVAKRWIDGWNMGATRAPDGLIWHAGHARTARRANLSQDNEFCFTEIALDVFPKSEVFFAPSRAHHEGRFAIVTDVERGMRWTCWVAALVARTNESTRTQKSCGPDTPTLVSSSRACDARG